MLVASCRRVAWLVLGALIHAGEAGFKGIDAGDLLVQGGEQLTVVGVELVEDGEVAGMDSPLIPSQRFSFQRFP